MFEAYKPFIKGISLRCFRVNLLGFVKIVNSTDELGIVSSKFEKDDSLAVNMVNCHKHLYLIDKVQLSLNEILLIILILFLFLFTFVFFF
jgi:hypothetical protein